MHRLQATIPAPRLAPYVDATSGTSVPPIDLYRWAGSLALAVFDDLANLEVAMRSAMAQQLSNTYGLQWYDRTDLLDNDTLKLILSAKGTARLSSITAAPDVVHGKLVATLMFGFWVKILGRGGYQGFNESRQRRIYDDLLWKKALRNSFPNVGSLDRAKVETAARRVQALRNRVAHHEHIVWGVPMAGERHSDGTFVRLTLTEAHDELLKLAGFVDQGLEAWLRQYSQVPVLIAACPLADASKLSL